MCSTPPRASTARRRPLPRPSPSPGGRAEFASDKIILDTLTIAKNDSGNYVEGTDYAVDYNFTKGTVIITSLKDDAQLAGSLTASFSEVDDSEIADSDIIGGVTSSGEYSGLSAIALLYPEQFAVCNLIAAPGWSHSPAVYNAMLTTCKKINGHWDAFVVAAPAPRGQHRAGGRHDHQGDRMEEGQRLHRRAF